MAVPDLRITERWRTAFATWRSSGLSVAEFCRSRDLNLSSFYRWQKIRDVELVGEVVVSRRQTRAGPILRKFGG